MTEEITYREPKAYAALKQATAEAGFNMPSETGACALLRTLAASKPGGRFLELGTGTGLATAWLLDGMNASSTLISLDYDADCIALASAHLSDDKRLDLVCTDGGEWPPANGHQRFDFIFADTWHGKYLMLDETLTMLNPGGFYVIDDMLPQANWPGSHQQKADDLINYLEEHSDFTMVKLDWSSGIILMVKEA